MTALAQPRKEGVRLLDGDYGKMRAAIDDLRDLIDTIGQLTRLDLINDPPAAERRQGLIYRLSLYGITELKKLDEIHDTLVYEDD